MRPRLTAGRLELACWFSGLALSLALISGLTSTTARAAPSSKPAATAVDPAGTGYMSALMANYQSRCIKRVMSLLNDWPALDIGKQIERQCLMPRVRHGGSGQRPATALGCLPGSNWRLAPFPALPPTCPSP